MGEIPHLIIRAYTHVCQPLARCSGMPAVVACGFIGFIGFTEMRRGLDIGATFRFSDCIHICRLPTRHRCRRRNALRALKEAEGTAGAGRAAATGPNPAPPPPSSSSLEPHAAAASGGNRWNDAWEEEEDEGELGTPEAADSGNSTGGRRLGATSRERKRDTMSSNGDSNHGGGGGGSGLFFSASEDEDFAEGVPRGVVAVLISQEGSGEEGGTTSTPTASLFSATAAQLHGSVATPLSDTAASPATPATLSRHSDRPIHVPLTQPAPVFTEDRLAERQAALRGLLASPDIGEREGGGARDLLCGRLG